MTALLASLFAAFLPLANGPDRVFAANGGKTNELRRAADGWTDGRVSVRLEAAKVLVAAPKDPLETVTLVWNAATDRAARMLTDDWCGLGWGKVGDGRSSAWYFLLEDGPCVHGYGVEVRPNAIAYWTVTPTRFELSLDVSAGGEGVRLGTRVLEACRLMAREGHPGETAFAAGRDFCRMMCPDPRLPREPVYGYNDWYCAYGSNTATNFLADAAYIAALAEDLSVRPYVVMDDGWQLMSPPAVQKATGRFDSGWGSWERASDGFGMPMEEFARRIAALGAKPGLWYRPLRAWDDAPAALKVAEHPECFDPTMPENLARVRADIARFRAWGFRLVKVDFLTYDIIGQYLFPGKVGARVVVDDRRWRDNTRTTAERMLDLHRTIREAAGDDMVVIGCGAFGHLAAGLFEVNRIGFDTSGKEWARTAKNGPNALGMRLIQHGTFYAVDPDCVGLAEAGAIPWEKNRQWLDLVTRTGTALFLSWRRQLAGADERAAFARSFATAASGRASGEPLDWMERQCPMLWRVDGKTVRYDWR